ncbi:MAG: DJ-1/PfpI family protein [Bacteroidota bacterium]
MKIVKTSLPVTSFFLLAVLFLHACRPVRNLKNPPVAWRGGNYFKSQMPGYSMAKKNVFIIADAKMTVLFDMLAPFYLFNSTKKANVYIIAKDKTPILIKRDLFVRPQLTFEEADSLKLQADVIVIPALSKRDEHQDTVIVSWIKSHFSGHTKMLAICDGASTAAATGLYDGKPLTCHASDYAGLKAHFSKPGWVNDVTVTKSGNLFSTAGVSNAVEGSLTVINELFDRETMQKVLTNISYPGAEIKTIHKSIAINGKNKFSATKKIIFRKNKKIGLLIENGVNEFDMATIIETYSRTFPASFTAFNLNSSTIMTQYGLTLISTGDTTIKRFNELHVLMPVSLSKEEERFKNAKIIRYDNLQKQYLLTICLDRIAEQYGHQFEHFVKISLDYN